MGLFNFFNKGKKKEEPTVVQDTSRTVNQHLELECPFCGKKFPVHKLVTCCLERYLELLPQLRDFLKHMNSVNDRLFQGCSLELNQLLMPTVWMTNLLPEATRFSLHDLNVRENALTTEGTSYQDWLIEQLQKLFPSFKKDVLDTSVSANSFITEAIHYIADFPGFTMIGQNFGATTMDSEAYPLRLGADSRIYRLTPYRVQLLNLRSVDSLFLHHPGSEGNAGNAAAKQASAASQQRSVVTFEPNKLSNMDVTLQLETGGFHLSWLKPTSDVQAEVKIVDESGITYYATTYDYVDSTHGSITKIPVSVLPFGKKLTVTITSFVYLISQEITLKPVEVALEMVETTGFLRNRSCTL